MLHYTLQLAALLQMLAGGDTCKYLQIPEPAETKPRSHHWILSAQIPAAVLALAAGTTTNHLLQAFHCTGSGGLGQMLSVLGHLHFHDIVLSTEQTSLNLAQRVLKPQLAKPG